MLIACLGWGSLIWKPDALPVISDWFTDGPAFPIEFSRVGDSGELATAISMNASTSNVLWSVLSCSEVNEAVLALRVREGIPESRADGIGIFIRGESRTGDLAEWAYERQLDAVIWTALPPRLRGSEGLVPTSRDAIAYLQSLDGEKSEHAREYIQRVPPQIDTPYRREIASTLGWA